MGAGVTADAVADPADVSGAVRRRTDPDVVVSRPADREAAPPTVEVGGGE
jgi:hypothetical protein